MHDNHDYMFCNDHFNCDKHTDSTKRTARPKEMGKVFVNPKNAKANGKFILLLLLLLLLLLWGCCYCTTPVTDNTTEKVVDEAGIEIGRVLLNVLDSGHTEYKVTANSLELCFTPHLNSQDLIDGNNKSFFNLLPETHGALYGFKHYSGYVNKHNKKGWLAHTMLTSTMNSGNNLEEPAKSKQLIMQEFWHSRTDPKNVDGVLIDLDKKIVVIVKGIQTFLMKNHLESNLDADYDSQLAARYLIS